MFCSLQNPQETLTPLNVVYAHYSVQIRSNVSLFNVLMDASIESGVFNMHESAFVVHDTTERTTKYNELLSPFSSLKCSLVMHFVYYPFFMASFCVFNLRDG